MFLLNSPDSLDFVSSFESGRDSVMSSVNNKGKHAAVRPGTNTSGLLDPLSAPPEAKQSTASHSPRHLACNLLQWERTG